jgi:hypothetical protein
MALAVRQDSQVDFGADGDYVPLSIDGNGALRVSGGGGGTEYTEDVATANPIVGTATLIERDDALSTVTPIEGDWIGLRGTAEGALWVQDFNSDAILADTANMDTNLGTIAGAVSGSEMQVDIVSSVLPTGAATAANQSTIIGHVDGIETLLGTIDADTGAIKIAVETLDNAISGSEMQVDVVAALPAGTNIIGNVGHAITGIGNGVTTVTTAGTDVALAGSTACKKVVIQAQTDNTGLIAVGATGVDATEATGTGIILYTGDTITIEIDNLADIFIDSTVNGEGVRFTYYT